MSLSSATPHLRLVGGDDARGWGTWSRARQARQQVTTENRAAGQNPTLDPTDPRWVVAVRAYSQLQGTTLTPERRQRVLRIAHLLGVRPFDANIIIAIVQDQARHGRTIAEAQPTIALLSRPGRKARPAWLRWAAAIAVAAVANALLIWWLLPA